MRKGLDRYAEQEGLDDLSFRHLVLEGRFKGEFKAVDVMWSLKWTHQRSAQAVARALEYGLLSPSPDDKYAYRFASQVVSEAA